MTPLRIALCIAVLGVSACASTERMPASAPPVIAAESRQIVAQVRPAVKTPASVAQVFIGEASWYGSRFHGRTTASGEPFDMNGMTAAHRSLPFGTRVRVINEESGQSVVVRVNDRGPFIGRRIIDLSRAAAEKIGLRNKGVGQVKVEVLGRA